MGSLLSSPRASYPIILIQRSSEDLHLNPTVLPIPPRKHGDSLKRSISPTNITETWKILGELGPCRILWVMSVIAVIPLKTGDSMFVGFDSLAPLHFSILQSGRFTDAIEQQGF
ncbi:hypothetical protein N8703_03405 [Verrucomicrobia bacterium]|nr:hypothetical protein [Verrucomicrobiota bacterium]